MTHILNIAGYKFITLTALAALRSHLLATVTDLQLKGTVLLGEEGINLNLAGTREAIEAFKTILLRDIRFAEMTFRQSFSASQPFKHMRVKIKKEIITLKQPDIKPEFEAAPSITPAEFKQWLDEERDITVLDTRNDYEVQFGTFKKAVNLQIEDFSQFPEAAQQVPKDKPIVMFCTGGIRCEKAAWVMLNAGYQKVFQLQGGILNYFAEVGGEHFQDECFVFDQRIAVNHQLQASGTIQCHVCQGPITQPMQTVLNDVSKATCPACSEFNLSQS